jgi:hypothetical protein
MPTTPLKGPRRQRKESPQNARQSPTGQANAAPGFWQIARGGPQPISKDCAELSISTSRLDSASILDSASNRAETRGRTDISPTPFGENFGEWKNLPSKRIGLAGNPSGVDHRASQTNSQFRFLVRGLEIRDQLLEVIVGPEAVESVVPLDDAHAVVACYHRLSQQCHGSFGFGVGLMRG